MAEDTENLSVHEVKIKEYWADIIKNIRRDLAYIWTDEVKRDFGGIREVLGQIAFILRILHAHYKTDAEKYNKEISDLKNLIHRIGKVEAKGDWVRTMYKDLLRVIVDLEQEKIEFRKLDYYIKFFSKNDKVQKCLNY